MPSANLFTPFPLLEKPIPQKSDDGFEAVFGADSEDFLTQLGRGADGLEADCDCVG